MSRAPTTARDLLWRAIAQCAGARWHSLAGLPLPRRGGRRGGSSERLRELARLIQKAAERRLHPGMPIGPTAVEQEFGVLALEVALAFQHLQLAEQRLLLGEEEKGRAHAHQFVEGLLAAAVAALGQALSLEEQQLVRATALHLPGRLRAQLELRQALQRGALPQRWILILGMHRSGTSALGGMLSRAGFDAPLDLMAADAVNPRGYWESQGLFRLNEALLEQLGSRWDRPERLPADWADSEAAEHWRRETLRHLELVFAEARAPLIKDPRLCLLLPGWMPWLESRLLRVEMVLTLRHPLEVASSLEKAQNLPARGGLRLWLAHVFAAEQLSRGWPRLLLHFDDLIQRSEASLERCLRLLAREGEEASLNRGASDFVLPELHRQRHQALTSELGRDLLAIATSRDLALAVHKRLTENDLNAAATAANLDALAARWRVLGDGPQAPGDGS